MTKGEDSEVVCTGLDQMMRKPFAPAPPSSSPSLGESTNNRTRAEISPFCLCWVRLRGKKRASIERQACMYSVTTTRGTVEYSRGNKPWGESRLHLRRVWPGGTENVSEWQPLSILAKRFPVKTLRDGGLRNFGRKRNFPDNTFARISDSPHSSTTWKIVILCYHRAASFCA